MWHPAPGTEQKEFSKYSRSGHLRFCSYLSIASSNSHFNPQPEGMGKEEKTIHFYSQEHSSSGCKCTFSPLLSFLAIFTLVQHLT